MSWTVPRAPEELELPLRCAWNGAPLTDPCLMGFVSLSAEPDALRVRGGLPDPTPAPAPDAAPGSRVANLWQFDVVELFWVGPDGRYVEIELGAHGHFLVLSFAGPRRRVHDHVDLQPRIEHRSDAAGWVTGLRLPWRLLPQPLEALGAFALARGAHVSAYPLPGRSPDFHQPHAFARASLEEAEPR